MRTTGVRSPSAVSVQFGQAETYWDVSFTSDQLQYLELDEEDFRSISVFIDQESGSLFLNLGYEEGSPSGRRETELFENFKDAIIEALRQEVPLSPEYHAFLTRSEADKDRAGRIKFLEDNILEFLEG